MWDIFIKKKTIFSFFEEIIFSFLENDVKGNPIDYSKNKRKN